MITTPTKEHQAMRVAIIIAFVLLLVFALLVMYDLRY
ncbi:hypothetical protein SAMN05444747_12455 [Variovorax sp. OV329]|nr:hypothetical protein SAMN05444747_12455 [Variovorax sp. OV329]